MVSWSRDLPHESVVDDYIRYRINRQEVLKGVPMRRATCEEERLDW